MISSGNPADSYDIASIFAVFPLPNLYKVHISADSLGIKSRGIFMFRMGD
jgi:hypothetical protein